MPYLPSSHGLLPCAPLCRYAERLVLTRPVSIRAAADEAVEVVWQTQQPYEAAVEAGPELGDDAGAVLLQGLRIRQVRAPGLQVPEHPAAAHACIVRQSTRRPWFQTCPRAGCVHSKAITGCPVV